MREKFLHSQRNAEGGINRRHFVIRKAANEVSQSDFGDACQFIAIDGAVMLQPFIRADFNLSRQTAVFGIHRGANYRGERCVDSILPGNDQKNPVILWVILRSPVDTEEIAALHEPDSRLRSSKYSLKTSQRNSRLSSVCLLSHSALRLTYSSSSSLVIIRFVDGVEVSVADPVGS